MLNLRRFERNYTSLESTGKTLAFGFDASFVNIRNGSPVPLYVGLGVSSSGTTEDFALTTGESLTLGPLPRFGGLSLLTTTTADSIRVGAWGG